jgi:GT2 family glycosyltransferase
MRRIPLVSIVVCNYNDLDHIRKCLESLEHTTWRNREIIVVDELTPGIEQLIADFPEVRLLHSDRRLGLPAARNKGASIAYGEYLAFLDNDTKVEPDWLSFLVDIFSSDANIACAQAKLLQMHNPKVIDGVGGFIDYMGFTHDLGRDELDLGQYDRILEMFYPKGACFITNRKVFNLLHGFDEDFFLDLEDVDFGWRVRLMGYRIVSCPRSKVYHLSGGTRGKRFPWIERERFVRNHMRMIIKNYSWRSMLRVLPEVICLYLISILEYPVTRRGGVRMSMGIVKGLLGSIVDFKSTWVKRKGVQKKRVVTDSTLNPVIYQHPSLVERITKKLP